MIKIMVVDDEQDVEMMFRQQFRNELKKGEVFMTFALGARQALDYLSLLDPFDIVLLLSDINMPGMTGFDLLKQVRQMFPDLRVIMVSAYGDARNHEEAIKLGAAGFVTKPVDFQQLKKRILESQVN